MLNKQKGNMYDWITHTWNTVKGICPHSCHYCYMKKKGPQKPIRFDEKELKTDLGENNFVFVGSSCDMWATIIPFEWIYKTLTRCSVFNNQYLFQTKNPARIYSMFDYLPPKTTIGATIETNRMYPEMGYAPNPKTRALYMKDIKSLRIDTMITIEPIMDFDLEEMINIIGECQPNWVNIGANSWHKIKLTEPNPHKLKILIDELKKLTTVKLKTNLKRILK